MYDAEILESLQGGLTELAQAVGIDPDGLDDDSVMRAIRRRFENLRAVAKAAREIQRAPESPAAWQALLDAQANCETP